MDVFQKFPIYLLQEKCERICFTGSAYICHNFNKKPNIERWITKKEKKAYQSTKEKLLSTSVLKQTYNFLSQCLNWYDILN